MAPQSELSRSNPSIVKQNVLLFATDVETTNMRPHALSAREAGEYLAHIIGCAKPFTEQQMWAMGRADEVPVVRLGKRRMIWQKEALDAFVLAGGTPRVKK